MGAWEKEGARLRQIFVDEPHHERHLIGGERESKGEGASEGARERARDGVVNSFPAHAPCGIKVARLQKGTAYLQQCLRQLAPRTRARGRARRRVPVEAAVHHTRMASKSASDASLCDKNAHGLPVCRCV